MEYDETYSFVAEWDDPISQLSKRFLLKLHCSSCTSHQVEMRDLQTKRQFLKSECPRLCLSFLHTARTPLMDDAHNRNELETMLPPPLSSEDFFRGANVQLFARDLKLVEYGDPRTKLLLEGDEECSSVVVPPKLYGSLPTIISSIEADDLVLKDLRTTCLIEADEVQSAAKLLNLNESDLIRPEPLSILSFRGNKAHERVSSLIGRIEGLSCPSDSEEASAIARYFARSVTRTTATFQDCACCVIKPHAVKDKVVGAVLGQLVSGGLAVTAAKMLRLDRAAASEFLQVYEGVVPKYKEFVDELCSGPLVALEIRLLPDLVDCDTILSSEIKQERVVNTLR